MELNSIACVAPLLSHALNSEELAGLEVAMVQRKLQENLLGSMMFWGKIYGATQDYLVVFHLDPADDFPDKKFYYCTTSDYSLRAFPYLSEEYTKQAAAISTSFLGDPSFFAYNGEDSDAQDPDAPLVERFKEIHRLVFVVGKIDHDCSIVPKGSYFVDATKKVIKNPSFSGLSFDTSNELRAFVHLRRPTNLRGIALLKRPGIVKTDDFLDSVDKDTPKDMWVITHDSAGSTVFLRNLYWDGLVFFALLKNLNFGCVYFGNGMPNDDLGFGL